MSRLLSWAALSFFSLFEGKQSLASDRVCLSKALTSVCNAPSTVESPFRLTTFSFMFSIPKLALLLLFFFFCQFEIAFTMLTVWLPFFSLKRAALAVAICMLPSNFKISASQDLRCS